MDQKQLVIWSSSECPPDAAPSINVTATKLEVWVFVGCKISYLIALHKVTSRHSTLFVANNCSRNPCRRFSQEGIVFRKFTFNKSFRIIILQEAFQPLLGKYYLLFYHNFTNTNSLKFHLILGNHESKFKETAETYISNSSILAKKQILFHFAE